MFYIYREKDGARVAYFSTFEAAIASFRKLRLDMKQRFNIDYDVELEANAE